MRIIVIKILTLCFLFLVNSAHLCASPQVFPRDTITDTVRCQSDAGQSYSLYLPQHYDKSKEWPVILILDPSARGKTGVSVFLEAGKKYGFILAGSNNVRNGPMEESFTAASVLLPDLISRFNIDPKRIYVAGFSGASRFAMALAVKDRRISGVIGCGAGLPGDNYYNPSASSGFLYYGLVGNRDMNYLEMCDLPSLFNNHTGVIYYIRTFSGLHEWPDPELLTDAVEWLILQSMNRKVIPTDQTFISRIEEKTQGLISSTQSGGDIVDATKYMRFAARDFAGTPFGSGMTALVAESEKSSDYQKGTLKRNKIAETEKQRREKYMSHLMSTARSGSMPDSVSAWWRDEIQSLVRMRDKGASEKSQMASRLLNFVSIVSFEQGIIHYRSSFFTQASIFFKICTISDSENPYSYYNLSRSLAKEGKVRESLDALSAAVKHGLNSKKTVISEPAFIILKNEARYKELTDKLK